MNHHNKLLKKDNMPLTFNITDTLAKVYGDIQNHGVDQSTNFTLG